MKLFKKLAKTTLEGILLATILAAPAVAKGRKLQANKLELPVEQQYNFDISGNFNKSELKKIKNVLNKISKKVPNLTEYNLGLSNQFNENLEEYLAGGLEEMKNNEKYVENIKETEKIWAGINSREYDGKNAFNNYIKKQKEGAEITKQDKTIKGFANNTYPSVRREEQIPAITYHTPWNYEWIVAHELGHRITSADGTENSQKPEKAEKLWEDFLALYLKGNSSQGDNNKNIKEEIKEGKITRFKGYVSIYPKTKTMFWDKVNEDIAETFAYYVLGHGYADKDPIVKEKIKALEDYFGR